MRFFFTLCVNTLLITLISALTLFPHASSARQSLDKDSPEPTINSLEPKNSLESNKSPQQDNSPEPNNSLEPNNSPQSTNTPEQAYLSKQRANYTLAKTALKNKDTKQFFELLDTLSDYPLLPYLQYQYASQQLKQGHSAEITDLIARQQNTYLATRATREYLYWLGKKQKWQAYRDTYAQLDTPPSETSLRCFWLTARLNAGDQSVYEQLPELWLSARSISDDCDAAFAQWRESPKFTEEFIWQRYMLAQNAGNRQLARYLAKQLSENYAPYLKRVKALLKAPASINKIKSFQQHTPEAMQIIGFGIVRYARVDPRETLKLWQKYQRQFIFDTALSLEVWRAIVSQMIRHHHLDIAYQVLNDSPGIRSNAIVERLIRAQLKKLDWRKASQAIQLLPDARRQSARWRYWQARCNEFLFIPYAQDYQRLANERSYFGFLAADTLGKGYQMSAAANINTGAELDALKENPHFIRAKELWSLDYFSEAHAEWRFGLKALDKNTLITAGALAHEWGWHAAAIRAMTAGKHWDYLDIRFPLAFSDEFARAHAQSGVDPIFLLAIARQESALAEGAISRVGARGLMQLMPATARQTAGKLNLKHAREDLLDRDHNIRLGAAYMAELLQRYQGNRIVAAAAYNAGPHKADRWLADSAATLPSDVWIETIPYKETRKYVQNVLTYTAIFRHQSGQNAYLFEEKEAKTRL